MVKRVKPWAYNASSSIFSDAGLMYVAMLKLISNNTCHLSFLQSSLVLRLSGNKTRLLHIHLKSLTHKNTCKFAHTYTPHAHFLQCSI